MNLSVLDLFTIGIGRAVRTPWVRCGRATFRDAFARSRRAGEDRPRVEAHLYGSLALTGKGHGTDRAILLGLEGDTPEAIDVDAMGPRLDTIRARRRLCLQGSKEVPFDERTDLLFHRTETLPAHPNGLRFFAFDAANAELLSRTYYSIGGGFVVNEGAAQRDELTTDQCALPYPFRTGDDLLRLAANPGSASAR
ncbi:MAG: serine dehydratase beta chain [Chthoniobacter sp.]